MAHRVDKVTVVVIGGGATGVGILRDLSMRGVKTLLVERRDLAADASGRFHGLLHSGARYAVEDPLSAEECIEENAVLRRIGRHCVEETEGLFVRLDGDGEEYERRWVEGCAGAGIPAIPVALDALRRLEPNLSPRAVAAYRVPDSAIDGFRLCGQNAASARRYGGELRTYTEATAIERVADRVTGVQVCDRRTGEVYGISCECVVNAAGAWVGRVASMAGIEVDVKPDRGVLIAFHQRFTDRVVNRLRPPSDGDIFVPHGPITVLGTTSLPVRDPDENAPRPGEVLELLRIGQELFEELPRYRILRAYAGARPLYSPGEGRAASRRFALLDHGADGLRGFLSITGGKLTSYRMMAEKTADRVCRALGVHVECRTAVEPLIEEPSPELLERARPFFPPHALAPAVSRLGEDLGAVVEEIERHPEKKQLLCECELVTRAEVEHAARQPSPSGLSDVRRRTRMGMGTCQGLFCGLRAIGVATEAGLFDGERTDLQAALRDFAGARWRGIRPVLWGESLREAEFQRAVYAATLNLDGAGSDEGP